MPSCNNTVGQHSKAKNTNKQVCEAHRKTRKHEVDKWKMDNGCSNKDGKYIFPCVSKTILHPATLEINHIDGNNGNRNPENIEVLCAMCHRMVTLHNNHHLQPRPDRRAKIPDTGLFTGLLEPSDMVESELFDFKDDQKI
jgi:hypothetical protein